VAELWAFDSPARDLNVRLGRSVRGGDDGRRARPQSPHLVWCDFGCAQRHARAAERREDAAIGPTTPRAGRSRHRHCPDVRGRLVERRTVLEATLAARTLNCRGRAGGRADEPRGQALPAAAARRVVRFVVRDGDVRWGSWGLVRRSVWALVLVEARCDGEVPTRNEKVVGSIPTGGSTLTLKLTEMVDTSGL
jgi:hypothetical protein